MLYIWLETICISQLRMSTISEKKVETLIQELIISIGEITQTKYRRHFKTFGTSNTQRRDHSSFHDWSENQGGDEPIDEYGGRYQKTNLQGILSNTENNSQIEVKEHVKAIALCSSKIFKLEKEAEPVAKLKNEPIEEPTLTRAPFPSRQDEAEFVSFLNLFKSLNKIKTRKQVNVSASCSAIISKQMPSKIGDIHFIKDVCGLGVNINIMPLSIYDKLRLGELKNTQITLLLAYRTLSEELYHPVDFIILDFEKDHVIPILLGRPFLARSRSTIDLENNELTMRINGEIEISKCGHQQN
ncbi:DNA damage-inducible protein 1-like [Gossypium australe]|uniref:DNA damage-inducible protein 1-like n=1 Tax=Gossypium australe TaxID=47621 RepID=A0A5B6WGP8_9ROSI|nr:DNA damage-inducible protein 1-like [Gossypium australe]